MNEEDTRIYLLNLLGREPMPEEINAEMDELNSKEEKEFFVGLYRRFSNNNLKRAIAKKNLTYLQITTATGIGINKISGIINFKHNPNLKEKAKLAVLLEVPLDDLFPERYEEVYNQFSTLSQRAEVKFRILELEGNEEVLKLASGDDNFRDSEARADFNKIVDMSELTPREKKILEMRFGLNGEKMLNLEETGEMFGVARERVRQIEAKALEKIRHSKVVQKLLKCQKN